MSKLDKTKRTVTLLAACQGLLLINNSVLITVNGLVGFALATDKVLATLPVMMYFVGSALTTLPISFLMKRFGRRAGFTSGAVCSIIGSTLCAAAVYTQNFWMLCGGTLVLGAYFAAGQYYRFAAAESAPPDFKSKAISLVLAGGIVGGIIGPQISKLTKDLALGIAYMGPYVSLVVFALTAIVVLRWLDIPLLSEADRRESGRSLGEIVRQPTFVVAVLCGMVSYGVMNLLMVTTPLAMVASHHDFGDAAFVIQWHLIGMYAPSFATGGLIQRFGLIRIMLTGVLLNAACVAIAMSGVEVMNFWFAMVLLGIGWNFIYVGATTLLTECHFPAERAKVQGVNDAAIFGTMVVSSVSSGALFTTEGWHTMNMAVIPFVALAGASIVWLAWHRKARPA